MTKKEIERIDEAISTLNNLMEKHIGFFSGEFGCDEEDVVDYYGFGYYPKDEKPRVLFAEVDSILESKYSLEQVEKMIEESSGDRQKEIEMILKIQQED